MEYHDGPIRIRNIFFGWNDGMDEDDWSDCSR